ncbi:MAG: hypothetical protein N4A68_13540 [Maledivibacter sp.]|jgi:hypothetical protein|nr:hypothetical protein [Maledivibacter sp.]
MFLTDYKEEKYNNTFESIYGYLKRQKEDSNNYSVRDLEKFLESLYANEGNNWTGRGEHKEISLAATIAAAEVFLTEWKNELEKN